MNIKTIIDAWIIAFNPTKKETELAMERSQICDICPSKKEFIRNIELSVVCTECGCPIGKKIYTNIYNACPLGKWKEVDRKYFPEQKVKKTLL